jgi:mannose-1-phosphate guanylyltransferase/mannose-6-phosphate isomerase
MSQLISVTPVILCGGSGTRLWPLSRNNFPKQYLCIAGEKSLFQQTVLRLGNVRNSYVRFNPSIIVANEAHRFLVADQLRDLGEIQSDIFLEPVGRNTAPALTMAAFEALSQGGDPILIVLPADQMVQDIDKFGDSIRAAIEVAADGSIVVLGVIPDSPETGFGYIRKEGNPGFWQEYQVNEFIEKPNLSAATEYISNPEYYWNGGIFVLKSSIWIDMLTKFRPDIYDAAKSAWSKRTKDDFFIRPDLEIFSKIPSESIDYAVMEHCARLPNLVKVVPLDAGWTDLGAWNAVQKVSSKNVQGNTINGDAVVRDSVNTFVYATDRLVAAVGLENLVIIETSDAVLVANNADAQGVKKVVEELRALNRNEITNHRKVFRPWGWYDEIQVDSQYKVKRIHVKPFASLSLQSHQHRSEHWVIVKGLAQVTNGASEFTLRENESTYIPAGQVHRLSNPKDTSLEIIEVQTGTYLGEDDIIRYDDIYGRES